MKQRITKQQYDELHDDQKMDWALSIGEHHNDDMKELETLPTIGQMIEYLDKYNAMNIDMWKSMYYTENYCDSLWEAVKEVLGK